ncbi:MAG: hypothetical protein JW717_05875 [Marinilabiliaceae bacterium]|nr:hypothetical protein [Marinilabiliaceae bacterium]
MRIISAHYAWNGIGSIIKNPKIILNDKHEVVDMLTLGNSYYETAHTEFFSGLLIPSFLADFSNVQLNNNEVDNQLNNCFSKGSLYAVSNSIESITNRPKILNYNILLKKNNIHFRQNPWVQVLKNINERENLSIDSLLQKYLLQPWQHYNLFSIGGSFNVGCKPGILLLNGINWSNLTFDNNVTMKIIDFPY